MRFKAKAVHPIYVLRMFGMTELSAYLGDGWFKGYYVDGYIVGGFSEIDNNHTELEYWIPIDKSTLKIYQGSVIAMSYEYEPIKDLEKEIEYVRWTHEKETRTHEKAVIGTQLEKLEARLHKFKQATKADEYEAKAEAFDRIVKIAETSDNHLDFSDDVDAVIKYYQEDK